MKICSFGCSFIFGTDLHDDGIDGSGARPSDFSWPALLAEKLGAQHHCYARPGAGNLQILERLLNAVDEQKDALWIIGWTWIDRFDYVSETAPPWARTQREYTRWNTIHPGDTSDLSGTYFRHLHSEAKDKLTSLIYVKTAIDHLLSNNQSFIMTYMDYLMLDRTYHQTPAISNLQDSISPYLSDFQGKNFLDFTKMHGHAVSDTMHPLETAHQHAADLISSSLDSFIKTKETR